jgi:hypothetical protein
MRANERALLAACIDTGISFGWNRAHKHTDEPHELRVQEEIDNAIWYEIDQYFEFEHMRDLCDEVVEGFDHLEESYDQTALKLCNKCGWKTVVPDDGCLNCNRREWVGLEGDWVAGQLYHPDFVVGAEWAEKKLKEKNT